MKLNHKRILFTAPRQYAQKLSSLLIEAGARPIWIPVIEVTSLPPPELHTIDVEFDRLSDYSHVAFTSKNGIDYVMERWQRRLSNRDDLADVIRERGVKLCPLGADVSTLEHYGLTVDVQPTDASPYGLIQELKLRNELKESKILCPVPSVRDVVPQFLRGLKEGGADVIRLDAYVTQFGCQRNHCLAEQQLLLNGDIHAIVFTSSSEGQGLIHCLGPLEVIQDAIQRHDILLAAHGPFTAAGVERQLRMKIPCISSRYHAFQGIVDELTQHLE